LGDEAQCDRGPRAGTVFPTAGVANLLDEIESTLGYRFRAGFESGDTAA